ncbi:hypothetical protein LINPERPRIM_LOCUS39252 [Linum perenne]
MFDYYITVARWTPEFNEEEPLRTILTWVRLSKLPIHFFNRTAITRIGNHIGRTVRLDLATSEGARARYARVCVDVDLSKPLLGKYMIGERVFYVEYESLENLCYTCGMYGHKLDACRSTNEPEEQSSEPAASSDPVQPTSEEGDTGCWMTVTRRNRKKATKKADQPQQYQGSRFTILQREAPEEAVDTAGTICTPQAKAKDNPKENLRNIESLVDITNTIFGNSSSKSDHSTARPLGDITNSLATQQANRPNGGSQISDEQVGDDGLVSVPVTYHKPSFVSNKIGQLVSSSKKGYKSKRKGGKIPIAPDLIVNSKTKPKAKSYASKGPKVSDANRVFVSDFTIPRKDHPPDMGC